MARYVEGEAHLHQRFEKRRTCAWYEPFENFYDGILQVANTQSFFKEHSAGFHTAEDYNHVTDRERIDKESAKLNEVQVM